MRGPLVETLNGNRYIGLAVCALTKYTESAGKNMHNLNLMEIEFSNFRIIEFSVFFFRTKKQKHMHFRTEIFV